MSLFLPIRFILAFTNSREEIVLIVPAPSSNSFEYRILAQTRERKRDVSNVYATFEPRFPRNLASNRSQLDLISEVYSKVSRIRFRMERDFDEINTFTRRLWRNINSTRIFQELILHDGNWRRTERCSKKPRKIIKMQNNYEIIVRTNQLLDYEISKKIDRVMKKGKITVNFKRDLRIEI